MSWIFVGFLIASMLHMAEEFFLPGGFMAFMRRVNPTYAFFVNVPVAIVINSLQLLLCVIVIFVGPSNLVFSLSAASLIFINGLVHIVGTIRFKGYVPGVVTGSIIYIPLSVFAFYYFFSVGYLSFNGGLIAVLLGLVYMMVPPGYFIIMKVLSGRKSKME